MEMSLDIKNNESSEIEMIDNTNITDITDIINNKAVENRNTENIENEILTTAGNDQFTYEGYMPEQKYFGDRKIKELARSSWQNEHYLRGCLWSPDGTCCLTAVQNDGMHILELQKDLISPVSNTILESNVAVLESAVHVKEGGTVYDYCWFPGMNSGHPETCCWAGTRQHEPIHLWDAFSGKLRCSYRGINDLDQVDTAISINFSSDGSILFAGYKKALRLFETNSPGNISTRIRTKFPISCIATNIHHPNLVALGSWNKSCATYDTRIRSMNVIQSNSGHNAGLTLIKFSSDGQLLVTGSRKENKIFSWDLRNLSNPLRMFERTVTTNQRIYFDISNEGNWLLSGDTDGYVHVWNMKNEDIKRISFPVHRDCCNGVSLNQYYPIIATSSGQYHGQSDAVLLDDSISSENEEEKSENSLVFWHLNYKNLV